MVMNWDGKAITGIINPGTDNLEIKTATLNPADWSVHIEAGDYKLERAELEVAPIVQHSLS
jgi:hypothetical protein